MIHYFVSKHCKLHAMVCGLAVILLLCPYLLLAQSRKWTLKECVQQALTENVLLNQGEANNEINKINYLQSKANQLPNLNLTDAQSLDHGRTLNPVTSQYTSQNVFSNSLGLTSSITLYNGLKYINLIKENRLNCEAGNLDIQKQRNDLMLSVVAAYMQVLFEYDAVDIARAQIEVTKQHLDYTRKYVNAGSMAESNLVQMQAQLSADEATEVDAENQLQLAKVSLMQFMELPVSPGFEILRPDSSDITPDISLSAEDIYSKSVTFLPEIKSASLKTSIAGLGLKIARSELMPKLTLAGNLNTSYSSASSLTNYSTTSGIAPIGYLASNPSEVVDGPVYSTATSTARYPFFRQFADNFGQGVSLTLSVPIFNNRLYKSDIDRSEVYVKVAELNERLVKNQLRKNIETAYADQLAAAKNYVATKKQLLYEERSYHDVGIKFTAGTANATDLFVEKNNFIKAAMAHLQAKYEYLFKTRIVDFYSGSPITQ